MMPKPSARSAVARCRFALAVLASLALAACVDTKNVTAFSAAVVIVSSATDKLVASDRQTCAGMKATIEEVGKLPKIGGFPAEATPDCVTLGKVLDATEAVNTVLGNYGKALAAISQGSVVSFDSDKPAVQGILKSLPASYQPSTAQITAISDLAAWLASLTTEYARQKTIEAALSGTNGDMVVRFDALVTVLDQLALNYSDALQTNAAVASRSLALVDHVYGGSEPVAMAEMRIRFADTTTVSASAVTAIADYRKSLAAMHKAFDAARATPTAKELLPQVRTFGDSAKGLYQEFAKAFPAG